MHEIYIRLQSHTQESSNISLGQRCLKNWLKTSQAWKPFSLYSTKQTRGTVHISKPHSLRPVPVSSPCNLEAQTSPRSHPRDAILSVRAFGGAAGLVLQSIWLQCLTVCAPIKREALWRIANDPFVQWNKSNILGTTFLRTWKTGNQSSWTQNKYQNQEMNIVSKSC